MTRAELIAELAASNPHLRQADVELIVVTIFDQISAALASGDRVELRGFGAFTTKRRAARTGAIRRPAKLQPSFRASRGLLGRLNQRG
jgi:integration host factor subunit beta